jgi:hypothetical protein
MENFKLSCFPHSLEVKCYEKISIFPFREKSLPGKELRLRGPHEGIVK